MARWTQSTEEIDRFMRINHAVGDAYGKLGCRKQCWTNPKRPWPPTSWYGSVRLQTEAGERGIDYLDIDSFASAEWTAPPHP